MVKEKDGKRENSIRRINKAAVALLLFASFLLAGCSDNQEFDMCTYRVGTTNSTANTFVRYETQPLGHGCDLNASSEIGIGTLQEGTRIF